MSFELCFNYFLSCSLTHSLASWLPHSLLKSLWQCRLSSDASRRILKSATAPTKPESELELQLQLKLESQSQPETVAKTSEHQRKRERDGERVSRFPGHKPRSCQSFAAQPAKPNCLTNRKRKPRKSFSSSLWKKTPSEICWSSRECLWIYVCTIYFKYFEPL